MNPVARMTPQQVWSIYEVAFPFKNIVSEKNAIS